VGRLRHQAVPVVRQRIPARSRGQRLPRDRASFRTSGGFHAPDLFFRGLRDRLRRRCSCRPRAPSHLWWSYPGPGKVCPQSRRAVQACVDRRRRRRSGDERGLEIPDPYHAHAHCPGGAGGPDLPAPQRLGAGRLRLSVFPRPLLQARSFRPGRGGQTINVLFKDGSVMEVDLDDPRWKRWNELLGP